MQTSIEGIIDQHSAALARARTEAIGLHKRLCEAEAYADAEYSKLERLSHNVQSEYAIHNARLSEQVESMKVEFNAMLGRFNSEAEHRSALTSENSDLRAKLLQAQEMLQKAASQTDSPHHREPEGNPGPSGPPPGLPQVHRLDTPPGQGKGKPGDPDDDDDDDDGDKKKKKDDKKKKKKKKKKRDSSSSSDSSSSWRYHRKR